MNRAKLEQGREELRQARSESRWLFYAAAVFSVFVNLLMLTGPIFMLQIYDRVLGSRSEETLLALFILMGFLFAAMGMLDFLRGRVLARIGITFQNRLETRVFAAVLAKASHSPRPDQVANSLRDLDAVQKLVGSPVFAAAYDIPWTPVFLAGILIFHPWLGMLALFGGLVLILITTLNQLLTQNPAARSNAAMINAELLALQLKNEAEMVRSLGMQEAGFQRWQMARAKAAEASLQHSDRGGRFTTMSKTFRMFLQSAMLGLGAYLVLQNQVSAGAMIASSILLGRALAPVDLAIGQWQMVQGARKGWQALGELLAEIPSPTQRTELPVPKAHLKAENLTVVPPGQSQASLRMVNFEVKPGQALGIIGQSGAGKTTLARAITGVWRPAGGKIRLDGAALEQYDPATLGQHIGYLPQRVQLFDGTIAENIAKLELKPDDKAVVEAAQKADAHQMILRMPDGYDTRVSTGGGMLSGGQMQRIGLARALYGNPVILVLDEPNSNLDNEGSQALNNAIKATKAAGHSVLIMAHRPAAIQECDLLLVLDNGQTRAFGPRDEVLAKTVKNAGDIKSGSRQGGVT
ncbi:MAG: type I secretion system permease/ATPase [Rhodobacteraceae bacterium]|nr:type I secretion system permease/ATPase [Paracoccaceae bacterium]